MSSPLLTIGMAHHNDFHGVYFTIQALRLYHSHLMSQVEILVVDNSPGTSHSQMIKGLISKISKSVASARYIEMPYPQGTSNSRNRIFEEAKGEYVICTDCHVLFPPGSIDAILRHYKLYPESIDLLTGPLMMDEAQEFVVTDYTEEGVDGYFKQQSTSVSLATHFENVWREEMWGIWGTAWQCNCSYHLGTRFSVEQRQDLCGYVSVDMKREERNGCLYCGKAFPKDVHYYNHQETLRGQGYHIIGSDTADVTFEIPGQGLGFFSCRKEAWLGFNPHSRGFGGEEMYIHEKFRQAGALCLCIPSALWMHRFGRPEGTPYPVTRWNKVRNYVVEYLEIGRNFRDLKQHFVTEKRFSDTQWETLLMDPHGLEEEPKMGCGGCGASPKKTDTRFKSIEEIYAELKGKERDLNQHMDTLFSLAKDLEHVTEIADRNNPTVAFLNAKPKKFVSYNTERDSYVYTAGYLLSHDEEGNEIPNSIFWEFKDIANTKLIPKIEETDLLFLDSKHNYLWLKEELEKYLPSCRRYIVVHDTGIYGENGDDGGLGLNYALRELCRTHKEWSVIRYIPDQYGLTILSCDPQDKPPVPPLMSWKSVKTFGTAVGKYLASGLGNVAKEQYEERLNICSLCPNRVEGRCSICTCFLEEKAKMKTEDCPIVLWPEIKSESESQDA